MKVQKPKLHNIPVPRMKPAFHGFSKMAMGSFVYLSEDTIVSPPKEQKLYLSLEINEKCPLKCLHCMYARDLTRGPLAESVILSWFEQAKRDNVQVTWTSISGKEPLSTPEFLLKISEITRQFSKKQIVMTNGLFLSSDMSKCLSSLIDYIDISLDGPQRVHDFIRGKDAFRKTWKNLKAAYVNKYFNRIGVITTLHSKNYSNIIDTLDLIYGELAPCEERLEVCVNFYVGWPGDPLRLGKEQVIKVLQEIQQHPLKTSIPLPASYSHMAPVIFENFGLSLKDLYYDEITGVPSVKMNGHKIVLFNLVAHDSCLLRISIDGCIYFGCTHLMKSGKVDSFKVGDILCDSLAEVSERVFSGEAYPKQLFDVNTNCESQTCYPYCMGGDRVGGYYLWGVPKDPYCKTINPN